MQCKNCGSEIPENAKFCLECGSKVINDYTEATETFKSDKEKSTSQPAKIDFSETDVVNKTPQKSKRKIVVITVIIVVVITLLAVIIGLALSSSRLFNKEVETTSEISITIPNVADVDKSTAKTILTNKGLIPIIQYEYDNLVELGNVTRTSPEIGSTVKEDSVVTIFISKGPQKVVSKSSTIEWYNISSVADDWSFDAPYIYNGSLTIACYVKFALPVKWKDPNNSGHGFGTASINEISGKTVPIKITYAKKSVNAYDMSYLALIVPLADLDNKKPSTIYAKLTAFVNGEEKDINVNFTMSW